mmetsp:Transcript_123626/g.214429  ORF Transcript_123626/g.214429 Transcript_123626/m.214429 type:complete len:84 (+) Transcript_123626:3-254(+)
MQRQADVHTPAAAQPPAPNPTPATPDGNSRHSAWVDFPFDAGDLHGDFTQDAFDTVAHTQRRGYDGDVCRDLNADYRGASEGL